MTDKMPDEIYIADTSDGLHPPFYSKQPFIASISLKYISEQKHAEEIAALKAEHRAEMSGLCDEFLALLKKWETTVMEGTPYECDMIERCVINLTEKIKQRISNA